MRALSTVALVAALVALGAGAMAADTTHVYVMDTSGAPGTAVRLGGNLQVDANYRVQGRTLSFALLNADGAIVASLGTGVTDSYGWAYPVFALPSGLSGTYQILVAFAGDSQYLPASATGTLNVDLTPTHVYVRDVNGVAGTPVTLYGNLQVDANNRVQGRTLSFALKDAGGNTVASLGTGVTDSYGWAYPTLALPNGLSGTYTIVVSFAGDSQYGSSFATGTLQVDVPPAGIQTHVYVRDAAGHPHKPAQFGANLQVDADNRLAGRTLTFALKDAAGALVATLGTGTTNSYGWALPKFQVPAGLLGTYQVVVSFDGDGQYSASSAAGTLTVSE